jgi:hypothetical protein
MRMLIVVATTMAASGPAHAEALIAPRAVEPAPVVSPKPARILVGWPVGGATLDRVYLDISARGADELVATLALELSGRDEQRRDIAVPLRMPTGARTTALDLAGLRGIAMSATDARADYRYTVKHFPDDPALLEWAGRDQLRLRAYPVSKLESLTVMVTIVFPRTDAAVIDLAGQSTELRVRLAGQIDSVIDERVTGTRRFSLAAVSDSRPDPLAANLPVTPRRARTDIDGINRVDPTHSLLAGSLAERAPPAPRHAVPTIVIGQPQAACECGLDKRMIQREVERHHVQLRRCYMQEAQRDPSLAGEVMLHFAIAANGSVAMAETAGKLAAIQRCLATEVRIWHFPRSSSTTVVNYPLRFRLRNPPIAAP